MPWWRARFSHSWGVLPTYFHTNPGQRMLEVREVQPPSRSCLLRGHSGDHGPSIMWTCCWEKNMKKTNKSNTCSSMIVSQMIKTACLPVLFLKKTCGFVWRAFNILSNPHSIHYTPWNKHNTWQEFYSKKATFLFRAWFLSAATREFWRVFFYKLCTSKTKKKKTIATQTTRVFPTAFSSQRKTAPLFLSHDFFSGDCLASWARQIGEANLKHSAKGTSFERYRGHYMKATQTIYYYEGLIPQNYHRFAACLIPKKKIGVLNNLPETKSGATSQTETSSSNRWFSRAVLVFRERHWDDDGDCYEYHFYLSPAGNMFSVYGANDSCTTMYFDHDCHGDNDNGCARWWQ